MYQDCNQQLTRRQEQDQDKRALWERPAFRRLMAKYAEGGTSNLDDGSCVGTGSDFHHSCHGSDIRLKREIDRIGLLGNGVGLYRFKYLWSEQQYVGVIAQEVARVAPEAVV